MNVEYLFVGLCSVSFISVLQFSVYGSFTSLIIVFFEVIVNGVDFLENSLSDNSLLVYRNAANFWILIFVPCNYWFLLLVLAVLGWNLWDYLYIRACHLEMNNFTSSFSFWMLFISLSCFIALARTSSTLWITVMKVGTLVLFLILEETLSIFHHWVWC